MCVLSVLPGYLTIDSSEIFKLFPSFPLLFYGYYNCWSKYKVTLPGILHDIGNKGTLNDRYLQGLILLWASCTARRSHYIPAIYYTCNVAYMLMMVWGIWIYSYICILTAIHNNIYRRWLLTVECKTKDFIVSCMKFVIWYYTK